MFGGHLGTIYQFHFKKKKSCSFTFVVITIRFREILMKKLRKSEDEGIFNFEMFVSQKIAGFE